MQPLLTTALALSACFRLGIAAFRVPGRGPGRTDRPDEQTPNQVPDQNEPNTGPLTPENPVTGPSPGPLGRPDTVDPNEPVPIMAQEDIQMNMGNLEEKLEGVKMVVELHQQIVDAVGQIVSGVLETPSCTWPVEPEYTCGWSQGISCDDMEGGFGDEEECTPAKFKPSTTLPSTSFAACTSYAKLLSSCASVTSSFYSLDAAAQASCACYATPATTGCSGTKEAQKTAIPSLATDTLDNSANACREFFRIQGYENVANLLGGKAENLMFLGADFCGNVDRELRRKSNASIGLGSTLSPTQYTDCKGLVNLAVENGGNRGAILGQCDRLMLIIMVFITALSTRYLSSYATTLR